MSTFMVKKKNVLPGFNLTMGFVIFYLCLIVLIPLSTLFLKTATLSWNQFWHTLTAPSVLSAFKLSLGTSFVAALINLVFGLIVTWVLVRYHFPGKKILDGLIDLPFALPTSVAGIALTTLYSQNGWLGKPLYALGIKSAFSPLGITIALTFIGLPFIVRTLQPILEDLNPEIEEAAASLGANRFQTFVRVIFPELLPALMTGFGLAFARAIGEYGSVIFISGNMPGKTEIIPLLIVTKLEQYDYAGATAVALAMLLLSFLILLPINILQKRKDQRA
jgi:sulfate transport system permease protein